VRQTIAVITPAHPARLTNGKLQRALNSVHRQTLPPDAIHVAVDLDGDGAAATRERALMTARTDWVAFLDSDDLFLPRHLQWLLRHAEETGADYVYSWFKLLQEFRDGTSRIFDGDANGDGIFPLTHFTNDFNPDDPIETTVTTLIRTELAQSIGFKPLDRGHDSNSGEDYSLLLGCLRAGAKVSHLKRKSWLWSHHWLADGTPGNTSGLPTKGDAREGLRLPV
jgi:glycosyltransferase involved in cell wall biosynthesis